MWFGSLDEIEFLSRLFDLKTLPSTDGRFPDSAGDIWQHRVNNEDWPDDWVFSDARFNLLAASDDAFLRFLGETLHPAVRADEEVRRLLKTYNERLAVDGWEFFPIGEISGRVTYEARRRAAGTEPESLILDYRKGGARGFALGEPLDVTTTRQALARTRATLEGRGQEDALPLLVKGAVRVERT